MNLRWITFALLAAMGAVVLPSAASLAEEPAAGAKRPGLQKASPALRTLLAARLAEQDAKEDPEAKPAENADDAKPADAEPEIDRFALPEGGVPELLKFLDDTINFRPKTREEFLQYRVRGNAAMKEAAEKILATATDEDKKLPGFQNVEAILLSFRAQDRQASDEDRAKLLEDVKAYLNANDQPSTYAVNAARTLAANLEYGGQPEQAVVVYNELGSILAKKSDEAIARTGAQMEGAARRLDLVGKPLEVTGTEIDGTKFDWAKLRGKVVLVDFWATWCGPCRAEMPNVRKNYELYHDKGFEVVAISLDRDREALEKFLAEEQTPWITLHDGDWKDNSVATYYGVMGIPTVILVGKDGNVLSTRARGEVLGTLLAEQLGPAEEPAADAEEKPAEKDEAGEAKEEKAE